MKKAWIGFLLVAIIVFAIIELFPKYLNNSAIQNQTIEDRTVTEMLDNVLYDKYVLSRVEMVNKLTSENQTNGEDKLYGSIWYIGGEMFYTSIFYNDLNKSGISTLNILISSKSIPDNLTEESASLLFSQYFKVQSQGSVICNYTKYSNSSISWCEKFWVDSNSNKMGMVAVTSSKVRFLGLCEYPKGSEKYALSSCVQWTNK